MRALVLLLLVNLSCRSTQDTKPPVDAQPEPAPAAEEMTYVSGEGKSDIAEEGKLETEAAEAQKVALLPGLPAAVETIASARELATTAADGVLGMGTPCLVSPALVPTWPSDKHSLVFVYFPLAPVKGAFETFTTGVPLEVTVNLIDGKTAHRKLKKSLVARQIKVPRESATLRQNIELAEQTLIELLLERREVGKSLVLLDGYREWFNQNLEVMTDLMNRMNTGVTWLRRPHA